jgi:hypothetical protein
MNGFLAYNLDEWLFRVNGFLAYGWMLNEWLTTYNLRLIVNL